MNQITRGRIYGSIAALIMLAAFVIEPQLHMPDDICGVLSFWQSNCTVGVQLLYRCAIIYCLLAGYFISCIVDRTPGARWWNSLVVAISATIASAVPLSVGFNIYYH